MSTPDQTRRFGRYEIEGELGSGGMSIVYRAYDPKMKRTVALKLLLPALALSGKQRARFFNEAYMASDLYHENVCTIFEADEVDGTPYIAMAFIKGQEVGDLIVERNLDVAEALEIGAQCCRGLRALHGSGVIHRDIKPSNIMVDQDGRVRIMDFGIAKQQGPSDAGERIDLTRTGTTPGTVAYMSPEQARGEEIDERSDLWSLGVVLYEMLCGERPFPRSDYGGTTTEAIINDQPVPIANFRKDLPKSVAQIIDKALQKDAGRRFQSADEMLEAIENVKETTVATLPIVTAKFNYALAASGLVCAGLLAGLIYLLTAAAPVGEQAAVCPEAPGESGAGSSFRADSLLVSSHPPNAVVVVDGEPVGKTDQIGVLMVTRPRLAGNREIVVCVDGYVADTQSVAIERGRLNEHQAALSLPVSQSPWADFRLIGLLIGVILTGGAAFWSLRTGWGRVRVGRTPTADQSALRPQPRTVAPTVLDTRSTDSHREEGRRLGKYELGDEVAVGSCSVFYESRSADGRAVVVKVLKDEFRGNVELSEAFRESMQTLERVQRSQPSPTLPNVYEVGVENGRTYAVLELLRGPCLLEAVETKGPLTVNAALEITRQICYGLSAIHKAGYVHGAVNLDHVIALDANSVRRIKLVGVGAHLMEHLVPPVSTTSLGNPAVYTAPEVAAGAPRTSRSDTYATGVVVYTLLEGRPPFVAESEKELIRRHAKADLPPMDPKVPPLVQRMVADMLQKNPDNRSIDSEAIIKRIETTLDTTITLLDTAGE